MLCNLLLFLVGTIGGVFFYELSLKNRKNFLYDMLCF